MSASTPPSTSPMNDPAMPAIMLIPSAVPRCSTGKASVRMAVELAISSAPPTPCTTRMTIRYIAADPPRPGVSDKAIDATVNTAKPALYIRTRPNMSPSFPKVTTRTAVTTR